MRTRRLGMGIHALGDFGRAVATLERYGFPVQEWLDGVELFLYWQAGEATRAALRDMIGSEVPDCPEDWLADFLAAANAHKPCQQADGEGSP